MMKRFYAACAALFVLSTSAFAAGTLPGISMSQQLGSDGKPLIGGKLYLIQAGTTATPQNCYQDSGLTIPHPNPITLNSAGRIPQLFCADGSIKVRLTNSVGLDQLVADNLLIVGPSGGGGGGGSVDPTTVLATGDFKDVYNTGVLSGFVRCNGRTIGSASSGATERANSDTSALFSFLYVADTSLVVSGGRGANAAADFAANKTLTLPDCRGRVRSALSDMGNSDSGRISTTYFGCTGLVLGCAGGAESLTLTAAQIPSITSSGSTALSVAVTSLKWIAANSADSTPQSNQSGAGPGFSVTNGGGGASVEKTSSTGSTSGAMSSTSTNTGGGAHRTVQPSILVTTYIKL